jgi:hypothetical protein
MGNPGVEVREGDEVVLSWTADDAHVVREESA